MLMVVVSPCKPLTNTWMIFGPILMWMRLKGEIISAEVHKISFGNLSLENAGLNWATGNLWSYLFWLTNNGLIPSPSTPPTHLRVLRRPDMKLKLVTSFRGKVPELLFKWWLKVFSEKKIRNSENKTLLRLVFTTNSSKFFQCYLWKSHTTTCQVFEKKTTKFSVETSKLNYLNKERVSIAPIMVMTSLLVCLDLIRGRKHLMESWIWRCY